MEGQANRLAFFLGPEANAHMVFVGMIRTKGWCDSTGISF
jgi:hypothetical protein